MTGFFLCQSGLLKLLKQKHDIEFVLEIKKDPWWKSCHRWQDESAGF
jgi:hypothetical protein